MHKIIIATLLSILIFIPFHVNAEEYFGTRLYESGQYDCIRIKKGDTWEKLWPDPRERDFVKRLNRMNTFLRAGMLIAIPDELENTDVMSISPFEQKIEPPGAKLIIVDLTQLAWGAYDSLGNLIKWGPASG